MIPNHRYGRRAWLARQARLRAVHSYFWGTGLPIVASLTLLCLFLLLARPPGLGAWYAYRFLVWNLFLAWVPYLFSLAAESAAPGDAALAGGAGAAGGRMAGVPAQRPVHRHRLHPPVGHPDGVASL